MIERRSGGTLSTDGNKIRGYAAVYGPLSEDLGGFVERVSPTAFKRSLDDKRDIRAFLDHDSSKVLGRLSAGTLRLWSDDRGLAVEIDCPDTSYARDLYALLKRGDVSQMSFGFTLGPDGDSWEKDGESRIIRTLKNVDLIEVSVVSIPAYPDTTAAVRSLKAMQESEYAARCRKLWLVKNRLKRLT
jgi:uncharacterized protein